MPPDRPDSARTFAESAGCRHGRGRRRSCRPRSSLGLASDPWRPNLAVVDAPRAGAPEEGEGLVVGIEDHLLRLARVGPDEQHPAVAKPDMRHLHGCRRPTDHHNLVAPVELVGLAWVEDQRHIGSGRCLLFLLGPRGRISPDRVIATIISSGPEVPRRYGCGSIVRAWASARLPPASCPVPPSKDLSSAAAGRSARMYARSHRIGSPCAPCSARPVAPGRSA